ncbi:mechanosensitive ion channel family protein [Candidatus Cetobacterium colombiensis]|uniref:Mechanosensitive ion channel n=1 Tax=Candidatus Cetobacterium colombiensis TaxID=3073100 RepID=A0ABU4W8H6_9FUSO|nr:mechanosensitive ion channel domain-containing protein [Candidatus Cetobacterium colombiensis]MDX8335347.1 mechanosensitive ion channel [Candidatus Cetobacterium colombiensis]
MEKHYNGFITQVIDTFTNEEFLVNLTNSLIVFIFRFALALIFFLIGRRILKNFLTKYYKTHSFKSIDSSFRTFLSSIIDTGSIVVLLIISLLIMGFQHTSLIAFLGSIGIGVGLALKDNLSNFVGGLIILIFKTYSVDDEVEIIGNYGIISSIDVFSTAITTFSGDIVTIPNGNVINNQIINYSKTPNRRMKIVISVAYETDIDLVFDVLNGLIKNNENILKDPEPFINVEKYNSSSIDIALKVWAKNEVYWGTYFDILKNIKPALDSVNITIPFPQMDVHIKNHNLYKKSS